MNIIISVIICTHNPRAEFFERVLSALNNQTLPQDQWELLVIDNASSAHLNTRYNLSWHPHAQIIREDTIGLTAARLCGIANAKSELLIFVDDDNVLNSDYLYQAQQLSKEFNIIGAFGGDIQPDFSGVEHPTWTRKFWDILALRTIVKPIWSNSYSFSQAPCGAGMVVRKKVAGHYASIIKNDPIRSSLDRKGSSLMSSGDIDLAFCACDIGMGIGLFPELKMTHIIPQERMTIEYLEKLNYSVWYSGKILDSLRGRFKPDQQKSMLAKCKRWARGILGQANNPIYRCGIAAENGRKDADAYIIDNILKRSHK